MSVKKPRQSIRNTMSLQGKKIILAITGSIAAYKTPQLVRLLVKGGADVKVVMSPAATAFVSPLSLATVSKHEALSSISEGSQWNNHVEWGRWADVMLIAPCSANTLAKLAYGQCDNILLAIYLSAICPVVIAPAMDEDMWLHPATKANLEKVVSYGHRVLPVGDGELASGLFGKGRMAEPEAIVSYLEGFFSEEGAAKAQVKGLRPQALVTAGPTYEALDPVRYIGNHSTGKMGIEIAKALADHGYDVHLLLGPSREPSDYPNVRTYKVTSAMEMYEKAISIFPGCELAIMSAAVADFRPMVREDHKIKKGDQETLEIKLVRNPDILKALGSIKKEGQVLVGFALETDNEMENALQKLNNKNADMIVLNSLRDEGAGFGNDTNKVSLLLKNGARLHLPLTSKAAAARSIVEHTLHLNDTNA